MSSSMLEIKNISKSYGNFKALDDVSLSVKEGTIYGLLGPNGAGKTSLIRIINQITMPDSGEIFLNGEKLNPKHVQVIGYMPEERGLYKSMKVGDQAMYLAQLKGLSKQQAKEKLNYWFERLDIKDWWGKKIQELSKGMAQKVQFVVTVLHQPKLLIFDEPFSGFDPVNANIIKDEILALAEQGTTIIFSTHRMESVEELCQDIALINKSKKIIEGNLIDIKRNYKSNIFEIGIASDNIEGLREKLTSNGYGVNEADFKTIHNDQKLLVSLNNNKSNDLIQLLISHGEINHFLEKIPSVNDIFIQSVSQ